ncbi:hypothetical protein [Rhizobium sp. NPDC092011]|uniref:hypothetical protein n=1 Tax=Rhizobium sp. NPDC092011 TaxID=3364500 RepID=UPI0038209744
MLEEVRPRSVLSEVRAAKGAPEEKMVVMIVLNAVVTCVSFPFWRLGRVSSERRIAYSLDHCKCLYSNVFLAINIYISNVPF